MAIYRGIGGAGDSNTDATVTAVTEQAVDAAQSATEAASSATQAANSAASASTSATNAASSATSSSTSAASSSSSASAAATSASNAQTARNAAELAQTAAETAQTGAETAETNAGNSAIAADASANDAATSEANAAASETASAASASAASTSATASANSATAASTSATAASTSAANAATSATNAATSEANAATSATSAATSATTATTKASEASTSATNAATSETNASTSETNAASSATAAASSATSASTSAATATTKASEAATSATNAATSETNAAASETAAAASQTAAEAAKDAALEALDSFDDRYLGQKASDPTLDNDGNALVAGALYFNTTDDVMKVYEGSVWVAAYASLSGALLQANNLSDVLDAAASRTNLGLGTAATTNATAYATAAQGALADSALQSFTETDPVFTAWDKSTGISITESQISDFGSYQPSGSYASAVHGHAISDVTGLQTALDGKVDDSQVLTNVPSGAVFTDTTYSVGNGGLTEINFTSALNTKLAGIEAGATGDQSASEILTAIKTVDGSGSGLDADTVDGIQAASFVRSDTSDVVVGNHEFYGTDTGGSYSNAPIEVREVNLVNTGQSAYAYSPAISWHWGGRVQTSMRLASDGHLYVDGSFGGQSKLWHAGNDGSGSGLDADTVDGLHASSFIRSDSDDTVSGSIIVSGSYRGAGMCGTYDSYKTQSIWAMGTSYRSANDGSNFGSLYGLAYKYTNNTTGGTMASGHQMVWCQNGTPNAAMGTNIWTSGNVTAYSDIRVKTNIEVIPNALDKVSKIGGYTFDRTDVGYDEEGNALTPIRQTGVIAQEILEVLPEAVTGGPTDNNPDGHYSVAYGNLVGLLIEAIKELKAEIDGLKGAK